MEIQTKQINLYQKRMVFKPKFIFSWVKFNGKILLFPSGYMDFKKQINRGFCRLIEQNDLTEIIDLWNIYYNFKSSAFKPRKHITYLQGRNIAEGMKKAREKKKQDKIKAIDEINNMMEWF